MSKRVLNVGQCAFDQAGISRFLSQQFDVVVESADQLDDALTSLRNGHFDLVLVNRQLDSDASDGLAVIEAIKSDASISSVPVMLVSNYADAHERAANVGAEFGFGKAEYGDEAVTQRLAKFLA
jgi:CheY-like chemotaxis protein